jgi:hypothetical protein
MFSQTYMPKISFQINARRLHGKSFFESSACTAGDASTNDRVIVLTRGLCWAHLRAGCTEVPHIVHMGFAVLAAVLFFILNLAVSVSDFDSNPGSTRFLAQAQSFAAMGSVVCKSIFIVACLIVEDTPKLRSLLLLATATMMCYLFLYMVSGGCCGAGGLGGW